MIELIRGQCNLKPHHKKCVATIGNFDAIHLGHQQILKKLREEGEKRQLPTTVITFEPLPNEYFKPLEKNIRLTKLREKLLILDKLHINRVLCLRFTSKLAKLQAQDFIQNILVEGLGIEYILIGDDFRFGHQRAGDISLLQEAGRRYHFSVEQMPTALVEGERISSSRVRNALQLGNLGLTRKLLQRNYSLCGHIIYGEQLGRELGFPTINIALQRKNLPLTGVYVVRVHGIENKGLEGVANIGNRPTVDGKKNLLEVHLFNFNKNIYGKYIEVEFLHKIREEIKFASIELMRQEIIRDAEIAKKYFASIPFANEFS